MAESKNNKKTYLNAALRSFLVGAANLVLVFSFSDEIAKLFVIAVSLIAFSLSALNLYNYRKVAD
jgi:cytochrome c biogenesis factor